MSDLTINLHLAAMLLLLLLRWESPSVLWTLSGWGGGGGGPPRWAPMPGTKVPFAGSRAPWRSPLPAAPPPRVPGVSPPALGCPLVLGCKGGGWTSPCVPRGEHWMGETSAVQVRAGWHKPWCGPELGGANEGALPHPLHPPAVPITVPQLPPHLTRGFSDRNPQTPACSLRILALPMAAEPHTLPVSPSPVARMRWGPSVCPGCWSIQLISLLPGGDPRAG